MHLPRPEAGGETEHGEHGHRLRRGHPAGDVRRGTGRRGDRVERERRPQVVRAIGELVHPQPVLPGAGLLAGERQVDQQGWGAACEEPHRRIETDHRAGLPQARGHHEPKRLEPQREGVTDARRRVHVEQDDP